MFYLVGSAPVYSEHLQRSGRPRHDGPIFLSDIYSIKKRGMIPMLCQTVKKGSECVFMLKKGVVLMEAVAIQSLTSVKDAASVLNILALNIA